MNKNVTIKGGVVMYGLSNDKRRATRDLDLDFIKYSLADESIKTFIDTLNLVDDGIKIYIEGDIQELHHRICADRQYAYRSQGRYLLPCISATSRRHDGARAVEQLSYLGRGSSRLRFGGGSHNCLYAQKLP